MIPTLLALSLLSLPMPEPRPVEAGRSAVLVLADGTFRALAAGEPASAADSAALDHAWVWNAERAPRRVEAEAFSRGESTHAADRRLALRVAGRAAREKPGLRVIAAPTEMWKEVPEALLPAWPVPKAGGLSLPIDGTRPNRLRAVGPGAGTWWLDLPPGRTSAVLAPVPAADLDLTVVGEQRQPLAGARISVAEGSPERGGIGKLADFRGDRAGRVTLPALPDVAALTLVVASPGHVLATFQGRPGQLPPVVALAAGATVQGRFVDAGARPLAGVEVTVRAFASDRVPLPVVEETTTGPEGRFEVSELPRHRAVLTARASGRAPLTRVIAIDGESTDLGTLMLAPAVRVAVEVRNDRGEPVAGATLSVDGGPVVTADAKGGARLEVAGQEPCELAVAAPGHLEAKSRRFPPFADPLRVVLPRSFRVRGVFLDAGRVPVGDATVRIRTGGSTKDRPLAADGRFELDLPGGAPAVLTLLSPRTRALEVKVVGSPGELRDLGDLVAPAGLTVAGRLVSAATGEPVAGARIWVPRPSEIGPLMAWVLRDLLETRSGEDGTFELGGLPPVPATLRIEAPSTAVTRIPVVPKPGSGRIDLGEVTLAAGARVTVVADAGLASGTAKIDLGGQSLPLDELTAPVESHRATIEQVPAGRYTVSILDGRDVVCENQVTVPSDRSAVEVECRREAVDVSGAVEVAGAAAGPGILLWLRQAETAVPEGVLSFSLGGVDQQHVLSPGRSQVEVSVDGDGLFRTARLRPGAWQVVWMPESGAAAAAKPVAIPRQERFELTLSYPGLSIQGTVVDRSGQPVAGAKVQELAGRASTLTREDGSFALSGFAAGSHLLRTTLRESSSEVREVDLADDRDPEPVRLELDDRDHDRLRVTVVDGEGRGVPGALVFLEAEGQGLRILTAGGDGRAETAIEPPYPPRLRAAAAAGAIWAFGGWRSLDRARDEGLAVALGSSGALTVTSREASGSPGVLSADGWNVSSLMAWLGGRATLGPSTPLVMPGLPPGVYTIVLGERRLEVEVEAGKPVEAKLD